MENDLIKAGDVVCLNHESGWGTKQVFTVSEIINSKKAIIIWHSKAANEVKSFELSIDSLTKLK